MRKMFLFLSLTLALSGVLFYGGTIDTALAAVMGTDVDYTLDADFDQGALLNVNHNAPNNDQLQLNKTTTPFPFVNIAASARGTIVRIDVNTGTILGEYLTSPDGMGRNPSRTTVDQLGNVWVGNRDEYGLSGGQNKGSVARVGLIMGGTRADADGTPNPAGQYLNPPFQYSTCLDRDGNGRIKTSNGLGNILPWTNVAGADTDGGVSTADDECIINYTRITGTGTRTVAIDAKNDVWVGGLGNQDHEKLSGVTGLAVAGTQFNLGCGGYGGLIDGNGVLWSAPSPLLRFDPITMSGVCLDWNTVGSPYGLGIDPNTGNIWLTDNSWPVQVRELNPADGTTLNSYPLPVSAGWAQGIAVDGNSHVWAAEGFGDEVAHFAPDLLNPGQHIWVGNVTGFGGTTGVAVDANGKIWASEINSNSASRIDPNAGPNGAGGYPVGAIDMMVSLGSGAGPYNYSDMTGFVAIGVTSPQGIWTVVQDSGVTGTAWGTITWNTELQGSEPVGTNIMVEARAADTEAGLSSQPFVAVSNGVPFALIGQFIEARATLKAAPDGTSPVLSDLSVSVEEANQPPDCSAAAANPFKLWPPNHKFVTISIMGVTDPDGDPVTITIDSIRQDEPVKEPGTGSGNTSPDGTGVGTNTAQVRAERAGNPKVPGDGRVYHIGFTATDPSGTTCSGKVTVCVPHGQGQRNRGKVTVCVPHQGQRNTCVDQGPLFDSTINP